MSPSRYFEERFGIDSGSLGYMSSYTMVWSFVVQVRQTQRDNLTAAVALNRFQLFEIVSRERCSSSARQLHLFHPDCIEIEWNGNSS